MCINPTYGPAGMVTSDESDVERQELAYSIIVDIVSVIFVLISTALVGVAVVGPIVFGNSILNRAGDI